ncbi:MAG: DUF427 domain-containing protein [Pseudomonadota bacterium]
MSSDGREPPDWIVAARQSWNQSVRPDNIVVPGKGQESVWDYTRPPTLERVSKTVRVVLGGVEVANTSRAQRICETASPPTFYVSREDVQMDLLKPLTRASMCEWKGEAAYFDVVAGGTVAAGAAWCYPMPFAPFGAVAGWLAFMPAAMDACYVGDDKVVAQPGGFYGGWITPDLTGPFKGAPGTTHW